MPRCVLRQEEKCHTGSPQETRERSGWSAPGLLPHPGDLPLSGGRKSTAPSLVSGEDDEQGQLRAHTSTPARYLLPSPA